MAHTTEELISATLRPEHEQSCMVAEIHVSKNLVEVDFPEYNENFRKLMRYQLNMQWSGRQWIRKITKQTGTAEDRAVEAGCRILAAGFAIRIFDQELRRRIISCEYEPEHTRWIMARTSGKYAGWFVFRWRRNEDYYKAVKKLPGSRYDSPNLVVPPESVEEVLDFAKIADFRLSDGAKELAKKAREIRERTLVVKIKELPKKSAPNPILLGKPPVLEVPQNVTVADEFKD